MYIIWCWAREQGKESFEKYDIQFVECLDMWRGTDEE